MKDKHGFFKNAILVAVFIFCFASLVYLLSLSAIRVLSLRVLFLFTALCSVFTALSFHSGLTLLLFCWIASYGLLFKLKITPEHRGLSASLWLFMI